MSQPRDLKLEPSERDRLRKLRAELGETRTARLFQTSKTTIELLLYDGGVTKDTRDRVGGQLRRMIMEELFSEQEMIVAIEQETPLKAADVVGLKKASPAELQAIVQTYIDTGLVTEKSGWEKICDILKKCEPYAGPAETILGIVTTIIAL